MYINKVSLRSIAVNNVYGHSEQPNGKLEMENDRKEDQEKDAITSKVSRGLKVCRGLTGNSGKRQDELTV